MTSDLQTSLLQILLLGFTVLDAVFLITAITFESWQWYTEIIQVSMDAAFPFHLHWKCRMYTNRFFFFCHS